MPRAQEAPFRNRPLRLIDPFASGAGDDLARAIAERLRETLGQSVVVDYRPGANTMIGAEAAARAPRDGCIVGGVAISTLALNPHFHPTIPYRLEDFAPLCPVYRAPLALAVTAELPIRDLEAAIAHLRANPGTGYGTVGNGSSPHLVMEILGASAGFEALNVACRGEAAAVADLITGRVPFCAGSINSLLGPLGSGRIRLLAISAPRRLGFLPAMPTLAESGHPAATYEFWHGTVAPAATPEPILERLSIAIAEAVGSEFLRRRATPEVTLDPLRREAFGALIRADHDRLGRVIRERGITLQGGSPAAGAGSAARRGSPCEAVAPWRGGPAGPSSGHAGA